jgi:hypothetical protein
MYLQVAVDDRSSSVVLRDVDNFRALKVLVSSDGGDLGAALAGIGRVGESGDAFLEIAGLRRLAGERAHDPEWVAGFEAMVEYARSEGWVDEQGAALQAHCERAT